MTIHWIGTGLSAIPGLRRLLRTGAPVTVWNRTEARAREAGKLRAEGKSYVVKDGDVMNFLFS